MPSTHEQVNIPDELRPGMHPEPGPEPRTLNWPIIVCIFLLVIGITAMTAGVAWWVHPGAGIAILGLAVFVIGVSVGFTV